ncbi:MAG TPA: hypothetical protein ENH19_03075 [Actinobacteria bacterium]|nr:hypothetical protein [Actinomycetes bacterium]HEX21618.1 hypothetical protein [Actinomycetota bacterium]
MDSDISGFKRYVSTTCKVIKNKMSTYLELAVLSTKDLQRRIKKLSKRQRDYLFQGLVLSVLVLPMISIPFITGGAGARANTKTATGKSLSSISAKQRPTSGPSRGVVRTAVAPQQPAPVPPAPAPVPPPRDPNLPPVLTQNTQNINPVLLKRFDAFRTLIFQRYRVVLEIKSGWRSYQEQAQLYATLPRGRANPPGISQHEFGNAIDYTNFSPTYNQYLGQFGLKAPYRGKENWHIEIVEPH